MFLDSLSFVYSLCVKSKQAVMPPPIPRFPQAGDMRSVSFTKFKLVVFLFKPNGCKETIISISIVNTILFLKIQVGQEYLQ